MTDATKTPAITATITGRGPTSNCPDCPGAVDADIFVAGIRVGGCTLMPPTDSRARRDLTTWGCLDSWACPDLQDWLGEEDEDGFSDQAHRTDDVIDAVEAALTAA